MGKTYRREKEHLEDKKNARESRKQRRALKRRLVREKDHILEQEEYYVYFDPKSAD